MFPVYRKGDKVLYEGKCYRIMNRDHSMSGIGYFLDGLKESKNQADLLPCPDDFDEDTMDVDFDVIE